MATKFTTQNIGNALGYAGIIALPILIGIAAWRSLQVKASIGQHEHGSHLCYCPSCNYEIMVEAYQKCNELYCPLDGTRMRAVETGEYRGY